MTDSEPAIDIPNLDEFQQDFRYELPPSLIAQKPVFPRDSSKLLVLDRDQSSLSHYRFSDLPSLLKPGDILVRNNTKVIPARLVGTKESGGKVEVLLNQTLKSDQNTSVWECLTKPGLKLDQRVTFVKNDTTSRTPDLEAVCTHIDGFRRILQFNQSRDKMLTTLDQLGQTPLPQYIQWNQEDDLVLRKQYQTTFAKHQGSVAAPTAGLHFTPELDEALAQSGIEVLEITLHVGLGTFQPVTTLHLQTKKLHVERFELTEKIASDLNRGRAAGRRVIAVGTTTARVLETCFEKNSYLPQSGETDLFIFPPYRFKAIDSLITNFHQSGSSLLMLVSALVSAPNTITQFSSFKESLIWQAYQAGIDGEYRFHSFGDAMLIL